MSLITTIAEFKKYIAIDENTSMATLQPYIDEAEELYVKALLGEGFYTEFHDLYLNSVAAENPDELSADNAALLPYIQRPLAYYTQLLAIPHLSVTFGDMGVRQHRGDDSDAAPRWLIEKLQLNALKNGDTHADKLLAFLESKASPEKYTTWYGSSANTVASGNIVHSTAIASRHIDIGDSRRIFLQLRPTIAELERRFIPKMIGQAQYDDLVASIKANTVSNKNKALIERIEPVIAKRALFMRLPYLRVSVAGDGIWLYSDVAELRKRDFLATREDIKALRCDLMDGELGYLAYEQELRQFILDNIADYPLIKASTAYTVQPDPGPTWESKNDPDNKFFSV